MPEHEHFEHFGAISHKSCILFQAVMGMMNQNLLLYRKILVFEPQISETHTQIARHVALFEAVALFFQSPLTCRTIQIKRYLQFNMEFTAIADEQCFFSSPC
jgi:hypothetical protein